MIYFLPYNTTDEYLEWIRSQHTMDQFVRMEKIDD